MRCYVCLILSGVLLRWKYFKGIQVHVASSTSVDTWSVSYSWLPCLFGVFAFRISWKIFGPHFPSNLVLLTVTEGREMVPLGW